MFRFCATGAPSAESAAQEQNSGTFHFNYPTARGEQLPRDSAGAHAGGGPEARGPRPAPSTGAPPDADSGCDTWDEGEHAPPPRANQGNGYTLGPGPADTPRWASPRIRKTPAPGRTRQTAAQSGGRKPERGKPLRPGSSGQGQDPNPETPRSAPEQLALPASGPDGEDAEFIPCTRPAALRGWGTSAVEEVMPPRRAQTGGNKP